MSHKRFYVLNILTNQLIGQPSHMSDEVGRSWIVRYVNSLREQMPTAHISVSAVSIPDEGDASMDDWPDYPDDDGFEFDPDKDILH